MNFVKVNAYLDTSTLSRSTLPSNMCMESDSDVYCVDKLLQINMLSNAIRSLFMAMKQE